MRVKVIDLPNAAIVVASVVLGLSMWKVLDNVETKLNVTRSLGIVLYFLACGVVLSLIRPQTSLVVIPIIYTSSYIAAYFLFPDPMFVGDAFIGLVLASVSFFACVLIWGLWQFWNLKKKRARSQ